MTQDEKGRKEVPIEPELIRRERARHEGGADRCDRNLSNPRRWPFGAKPICDGRGAPGDFRERRSS
jgi:hypothetical protein